MLVIRSPQFYPKLESLRGLAALAVCFGHSIVVYRLEQIHPIWTDLFWRQSLAMGCLTLLKAIFSAHAAVVLFFVLSGWVLTKSLAASPALTARDIASFYLRRGFRILPMMWSALVFTYLLSKINHASPFGQASGWYAENFERPVHLGDFFRNCVLVQFNVSPITWTMRREMLGSLVLPFMVYFNSRCGWRLRLLLFGALCGLTLLPVGDPRYLICFYVGVLLTENRKLVYAHSPAWLVGSGLALCGIVRLTLLVYSHLGAAILIESAGTGLILLGILGQPSGFEILESSLLRMVGRFSYSLYLLHPAVLGMCSIAAFAVGLSPAFSPVVSNVLLFIVSVSITLPLSAITYRWIEHPFIAWGGRLSNFFRDPANKNTVLPC